jgi:hypothetical protein
MDEFKSDFAKKFLMNKPSDTRPLTNLTNFRNKPVIKTTQYSYEENLDVGKLNKSVDDN